MHTISCRNLLTALLFFLVASCSKKSDNSSANNPGGGGATGNAISITSSTFPATFTVKVGTTLKWTNNDSMAHTVTSDDGSTFDSGNLAAGASYSYKFTTAGTYNYHCDYHAGMTGSIVVQN
ncbi:hypothetical protein BH20BAC1_BH20BAC1_06190 [soil metagenome]